MAQILSFSRFPFPFRASVFQGDFSENRPFPAQALKQVHGTQIIESDSLGPDLEGDALITCSSGVPLLIKTADCIPLVMADPVTGWIAAVHAGWRGLSAGIVPAVFQRLREKGVSTSDCFVGIGPSLGVECARFSDPTLELPKECHWAIRTDGHVDLWAILERQLSEAGVDFDRVEWMKVCTACTPEWFSWRRDHDSRRFGTTIERL